MAHNRLSLPDSAAHVYATIARLERSVELDPKLRELVRIRASQINGCAYCIDMHTRDGRAAGESERRMHGLSAWRETPFFDEREQAALALTEAVTLIADGGVSDEVYAEAARHFPDAELAQLIGAIIAINTWNRVALSTGTQPPLEIDEDA